METLKQSAHNPAKGINTEPQVDDYSYHMETSWETQWTTRGTPSFQFPYDVSTKTLHGTEKCNYNVLQIKNVKRKDGYWTSYPQVPLFTEFLHGWASNMNFIKPGKLEPG